MIAESPQCNDLILNYSAINLRIGTNAYFHRTIAMKKISTILTAGIFTILSATAFACPQGTTLTGGTGANHKGGTCVSITKDAKHQERTATHAAQVAHSKSLKDEKMAKQDAAKAHKMAQQANKPTSQQANKPTSQQGSENI